MKHRPSLLLLTVALAGCTLGPDYQRPAVSIPPAFQEAQEWKPAAPGMPAIDPEIWSGFHDTVLTALLAQARVANPGVQSAEAAVRAAQAVLAEARAAYFPVLGAGFSGLRSGSGSTFPDMTATHLGANASWELDLWGSVRRSVEAGTANAAASATDYAAAILSTEGTVAQTYMQLRVDEANKRLLESTVLAYAHALEITRSRYKAGVASRLDVAQAETLLKSIQTSAVTIEVQIHQLQHALAVLVGQSPAMFRLAARSTLPELPIIPAVLPTQLLERRPDVSSAERRVVAANAQIGIAETAYFPGLNLAASAGFQGSTLANLGALPFGIWSVGPALAETLFDGGLRAAQVAAARAVWEQSTAAYRQTVLAAFQNVEDNLAALRIESQALVLADNAASAALQAQTLALKQYKAGTVSYLNVTTAQTSVLTTAQAALNIRGQRLVASVLLIEALGGGWQAAPSQSAPPPAAIPRA